MSIGSSGRAISVTLRAEVGSYVAAMTTAANATRGFATRSAASVRSVGSAVDTMARTSPAQFHSLTTAIGATGAGLLALAGYATHVAAAFDKQMSAVQAATHGTAKEMSQLRAAALQAGADTAFTASGAARAIEELAKAGLRTSEILGGGLKGALDLASAGSLDVGEAGEVAATALRQFNLSGMAMPHVADLLAAAAGKAQGDVHQIALAMRQSGLVANQFGLSIEETTGTLAAFASAGLLGSDAGTSFKQMLLQLSNPSKQAAATMRELGIHAYDAGGKFVGITALAGQLKDKMAGLTQAERDAAMATIFGSDAVRAANVLYKEGAGGIADWVSKVNDTGYASDTAAAKLDNLSGDVEKLKGSLETVMINSGSGATAGLRQLTQAAENVVNAFGAMPSSVQSTTVVIAGLAGASLLGVAGFMKLRQQAILALDALTAMGPAGATAAAGLGKAGKVATGIAVALAAAQVASAAFGDQVDPKIGSLAKGLMEWAKSGKVAGETARVLGGDLGLLDQAMYDLLQSGHWSDFIRGTGGMLEGLTGLGSVYEKSLMHSRERIQGLDQALTQMVQSGHGAEAAEIFQKIADRGAKMGISVNELKKGLPGYSAALDGAMTSETKAIEVKERDATATGLLSMAMRDTIDIAGGFEEVFDRIHGAMIGYAEAEIAAEKAVDDLSDSFNRNGASLLTNSKAGRENRTNLIDLAEASAKAAQKKWEETGSVDAATAVYNTYKAKLIEVLLQSGRTRAEAEALANEWMAMPPLVATRVVAPGLPEVVGTATNLRRLIDSLDGRVAVSRVVTVFETVGSRPAANARDTYASADGNVFEFYGSGGVRENHVAQFAPAGAMRVWAEPETGGEAYIPLTQSKWPRSRQVWLEAGRRIGMIADGRPVPGLGGGSGGTTVVNNWSINVPPTVNKAEVGREVVSVIQAYETRSGRGWRS